MSSVDGKNSNCLIDWSSPATMSHGKPLIPIPPMFNNTLESVDDNNPFDAIERLIMKNDPLDLFNDRNRTGNNKTLHEGFNKACVGDLKSDCSPTCDYINQALCSVNISDCDIAIPETSVNKEFANHLNHNSSDNQYITKEYVAKRINNCIQGVLRKVAEDEKVCSSPVISEKSLKTPVLDLLQMISPNVLEKLQYKTRLSPSEKINCSHNSNYSNLLNAGFMQSPLKSASSGYMENSSHGNLRSYPSSPISSISPNVPLNERKHNMSLPDFPTNSAFSTPTRRSFSISLNQSPQRLKMDCYKMSRNVTYSEEDIASEEPNWICDSSSDEELSNMKQLSPAVFHENAVANSISFSHSKSGTHLQKCSNNKPFSLPLPSIKAPSKNADFRLRKCDTTTEHKSQRGPLRATVKVQDMTKISSMPNGCTSKCINQTSTNYSVTPKTKGMKRPSAKSLKPIAASTPDYQGTSTTISRRSLPPKISSENKSLLRNNRSSLTSRLSPDSTSDNGIEPGKSPLSRYSQRSHQTSSTVTRRPLLVKPRTGKENVRPF